MAYPPRARSVIYPVPKPRKVSKPKSEPKARRRLRPKNARRKGSSFPKVRDKKYRDWVRLENLCMLRGAVIGAAFSSHDVSQGLAWRGFKHVCWGANTPAHVGKHQATGAADFGRLVPLCQAAHQAYDEHRHAWSRYTGYTEVRMENAAADYALKYVQQGGVERGGAP